MSEEMMINLLKQEKGITSMEKRKTSVMTKGQVYSILEGLVNNLRSLKTVKEVREHLDQVLPQYKPSARGRKAGATIDLNGLQTLMAEEAEKIAGNDGRFLLGMVATAHNRNAKSASDLLDASRLRKLVESGKLALPEQFSLPARQVRKRKTTNGISETE